MGDLAEHMMRATYGKSADPHAPENQNRDFKSGFRIGSDPTDVPGYDAIYVEWMLRGSQKKIDKSFTEWKRGYWAAVFRNLEKLPKKGRSSRSKTRCT